MQWFQQIPLFLIGFSSLLPLINPVGTAFIIDPYFEGQSFASRRTFAFKIVFYCFVLGILTLLLGSWCLKFMGISIPTTQIAGGFVIARMGLSLLNAPSRPSNTNSPTDSIHDVVNSLFYPLAFPLTLGPGGISTLLTLSAHAHGSSLAETWLHMGTLCISLLAVCTLTYFCFVYSHVLLQRIGPSGSLVINRLLAFLVFCIGIQMIVTRISHMFPGKLS